MRADEGSTFNGHAGSTGYAFDRTGVPAGRDSSGQLGTSRTDRIDDDGDDAFKRASAGRILLQQ